jgi:hypothetical protein
MTSRLRPTKTGTLASLLSDLRAELQAAVEDVRVAHRRHGDSLHREQKVNEARMRHQGIPLPIELSSRVDRWDDPSNPAKRCCADVDTFCRELARANDDFRAIPPEPELRVAARPRSDREAEPLLFRRSAVRLATLLVHLTLERKWITPTLRTLRRNPLEIGMIALAGQTLHQSGRCPCGGSESCVRLAVSRALTIVMEGIETPIFGALRALAERVFHASLVLKAVSTRLKSEPRARQVELLAKVASELDRDIRNHLRSAIDQAPRESRARQWQLHDASRYLELGRFSDAQIAYLLPDCLAGDPVQRVRNRLNELAKEDPQAWWMRFVDPVAPEAFTGAESTL